MEKKTAITLSVVVAVAAFILGIGLNQGQGGRSTLTLPNASSVRADLPGYKLINPLLFHQSEKSREQFYISLSAKASGKIAQAKQEGSVVAASVYMRDLNSGTWTGVNEDDTYNPSSMLKVIIMMAALKLAEQNPEFLEKKLYYKPDESTVFYKVGGEMKAGYYKIPDLIYSMIVYSDNASSAALLTDKEINDTFNFVYELFQLPRNTFSADSPDFMSAKTYSSVFRVLYNSTLFPWHLSEQILDLLTKTKFNAGLVAGVPSDVTISHKFGEAAYETPDQQVMRELHDCGIVYLPGKPYFICIMTKGPDVEGLTATVAGLSRVVYEAMNAEAIKSSRN